MFVNGSVSVSVMNGIKTFVVYAKTTLIEEQLGYYLIYNGVGSKEVVKFTTGGRLVVIAVSVKSPTRKKERKK